MTQIDADEKICDNLRNLRIESLRDSEVITKVYFLSYLCL